MYPEHMVAPMRKDLSQVGFKELRTSQEVDDLLGLEKGTVLVVINSVCGCAAGNARPGVKTAIKNEQKPDHITTVFAGVDTDAVAKAREFMAPFPPSSPCIALFKDGEVVHMLERHHIEGRSAEAIAANLMGAFDDYC
jgi:putative YphP/YqiW family bacilliredoxin